MKFEFKPYDCLIIDEAESFFEDIFSGLCRGANFEFGVKVFTLLMTTTPKIFFLDGFMKNSALSIAMNYASSVKDVRLVIGDYINKGTL